MERDKELLLPVEGSDSDDIVEEFKLPPPRTRRPKARKAIAEARIAASNQSLLSWKCCLMFILVSIFISGVLVLAFFMLSMQSEINNLTIKMAQANVQIQHLDSIEISTKKLMEKLDEYKQKFSKQDLNIKLFVHQIRKMNKTIQKISSSNELASRLSILERDVDSMKTGMASTGGSIAKMQSEILQHDDKFESVLTELKNVKIAIYHTSTKNKTVLERLTRPISVQTQKIQKLKLMIREVNRTHTQNAQRIATEIYNRHVEFDEKINKLDIKVSTVNDTHTEDNLKVKTLLAYKNKSELVLATQSNDVSLLMNLTGSLQKKLERHHNLLKKYTNLGNDIKQCQALSKKNDQNIQILQVQVAKHGELIKKNENSSLDYMRGVQVLLNHSKTAEEMINHHHKQLEKYANKINSFKSPVGSTVIPATVVSEQPKSTLHLETSAPPTQPPTKSQTESSTEPPTQPPTQPPTKSPTQPITKPATEPPAQPTQPSSTIIETIPISTSTSIPATPQECPLSCGKAEKCKKTRKGYKCICASGYAKVGKYCEDINECQEQNSNNCHTNASCKNTFGSYVCVCNDGFEGNGTHCKVKKEVCPSDINATCDGTQDCVKIETGEWQCKCKPGYVMGMYCSDMNECYDNGSCHVNADCINTIGSFQCKCKDGFRGNGTYCEAKSNETNIATTKQPVVSNENMSTISTPPSVTANAVDVNSSKDSNIKESVSVGQGDTLPLTNLTTVSPDPTGLPVSSVPDKDNNSQGIQPGTVKPEHSSTTDPGVVMTPEMPDEGGRYDESTLNKLMGNDQSGKNVQELNKMFGVLKNSATGNTNGQYSLGTMTKGDDQDDLNTL